MKDKKIRGGEICMKKYAAAIALTLCAVPAVNAADIDVIAPHEQSAPLADTRPGWALQVTPYMWATGLKGHISPFRHLPTIGIHKSFSDVMDKLDFGGFINIWGRYERFIVSGDIMYVSTTDSHSFGALPHLPPPLPQLPSLDASIDSRQFMATLMGGYRLVDTPDFSLDGLAGIRFWHISNDVTLRAGNLAGTYGERFGWADPVVGTRAFLRLTENLSLQAQADIGGFTVGSDLTWSVQATANYTFTDHFSVSAGYKILDIDYRSGGHVFDTRMSGPVLGLTYRF